MHRTTVWATLHVQAGSVRYVDLTGDDPRDVTLDAGDSAVIAPGVAHQVEPSTDATFLGTGNSHRHLSWPEVAQEFVQQSRPRCRALRSGCWLAVALRAENDR